MSAGTALAWTPAQPAQDGTRVSFRQPISGAGFVDVAWWPRSRDLVAELDELIPVFNDAGRPVYRISYYPAAWDGDIPRYAQIAGHQIELSGFVEQNPLLLLLADDWRDARTDVLVIPPDTDPAVAERALLLAAESDNIDRPAAILTAAAAD